MQKDTFMSKKIKENAKVKIVFRSDIDSSTQALKGEMLDEDKDFFYIENYIGDVVSINKTKIISMIFQESKDPKSEIKDPVKQSFEKGSFSYSRWWKDANIKEVDKK